VSLIEVSLVDFQKRILEQPSAERRARRRRRVTLAIIAAVLTLAMGIAVITWLGFDWRGWVGRFQ
jgi:hypothetical protein